MALLATPVLKNGLFRYCVRTGLFRLDWGWQVVSQFSGCFTNINQLPLIPCRHLRGKQPQPTVSQVAERHHVCCIAATAKT